MSSGLINLKEYKNLKRKERIEKEWQRLKSSLNVFSMEDELLKRIEHLEEGIRQLQNVFLSHDVELDETDKRIELIMKVLAKLSIDSK